MSKYVKNLITDNLRDRFKDVGDAILVNMVGLDANANNRLRAEFDQKNVRVMVVKNSLAARAAAGTPLAAMFEGLTGSSAVCWGGGDIVSLAKEVARLAKDEQYEAFRARGGVMDGEKLSPEEVAEISKWPSREEVLGQIVGQIVGPGAALAGLVCGPGSLLASQVARLAESGPGEEGKASGG